MFRAALRRLKAWIASGDAYGSAFDAAEFERLCIESPAQAVQMLRREQRVLNERFERTCGVSSERMARAAQELRVASDEHDRASLRRLCESQERIRQLLLRIDATTRTEQELEREAADWEVRVTHHSGVRLEIVRSELALRRDIPRAISIKPARPTREAQPQLRREGAGDVMASRTGYQNRFEDASQTWHELSHPHIEQLLQAIRMIRREIGRHADAPEASEEILEEVHRLRALHATLKRLDREQGTRRDRQEFFMQTISV